MAIITKELYTVLNKNIFCAQNDELFESTHASPHIMFPRNLKKTSFSPCGFTLLFFTLKLTFYVSPFSPHLPVFFSLLFLLTTKCLLYQSETPFFISTNCRTNNLYWRITLFYSLAQYHILCMSSVKRTHPFFSQFSWIFCWNALDPGHITVYKVII